MRPPCCDKVNVKKGLWTQEEDAKLHAYVSTYGTGNWTNVPQKAGLKRCGKSCRLRWTNYLRPNLKHEGFTSQEEKLIVILHATIGSRWSVIAKQLPGRTDNDVKNYWNTKLSKKLALNGIDPVTHRPISEIKHNISTLHHAAAAAAAPHDSLLRYLNRDLNNILLSRPTPPPPPEASSPSSASSTGTMPTVHWNIVAPPPPPPPQVQVEWAEYLTEDALLYFEEQDANHAPSVFSSTDVFGLLEEEEVSSINDGTAAGGSSSFVDEILDRDREMMLEFSGLLTGPYFI